MPFRPNPQAVWRFIRCLLFTKRRFWASIAPFLIYLPSLIMSRFVRLGAFRDFLGRYRTVWRNVWAVRDQLDPPKRDADELAFLPAHLELTETPLSAAPKWSARTATTLRRSRLCRRRD